LLTLKAARVNKNLTQKEAAKRLGIALDTLRMYEIGRTFPTVLTIRKMEDLYGVGYNDIDFLLPEDNGLTVTENEHED